MGLTEQLSKDTELQAWVAKDDNCNVVAVASSLELVVKQLPKLIGGPWQRDGYWLCHTGSRVYYIERHDYVTE